MPFAWSLVPQPVRRLIAPVEPGRATIAPTLAPIATQKPLDADAPLPLGDDLPHARAEPMGPRRRTLIWTIALLALALRLLLLPFGHWWDLTVDYNVFIDLAHNHSPYDTFVMLSHIARSAQWDTVYEYFAYPPVSLYIYWPLAHLFALLHPTAHYVIIVSSSPATPILPLSFYVLFKLPIWVADFAIATLMMRMSGTARGFRDYLLNPYVLLISGAWTFDAIMVLGMVAAVYLVARGRVGWAGVALAFGTMVKFIPVLLAPTIVLYLIKKQRPFREIALFTGAFVGACIVLVGPFWQGLAAVTAFHASRPGGGMTWMGVFSHSLLSSTTLNLGPTLMAFSAFGTPTLIIALLLGYWWIFIKDMSLTHMALLTLCAFFVGSKLINEQYALSAIPFLWLVSHRAKGAWRWLYRLFWVIPLTFAIMHVPIDHFFFTAYHTFFGHRADSMNWTGATGLDYPVVPWNSTLLDQPIVVALGVVFFLLNIVTLLWPVPPYAYAYAAADATADATVDANASSATPASDATPATPAARAGASVSAPVASSAPQQRPRRGPSRAPRVAGSAKASARHAATEFRRRFSAPKSSREGDGQ
ncbi:MAG TPA: glycosyltransferase family 87 protein [Ktedonobacterales bacterium]